MEIKTFQERLALLRAKDKKAKLARKAREAAAEGFHTNETIKVIRDLQGDCCVYCKDPLNGKGCRDHILPLVRGGSNWPENIHLLCKRCSGLKGTKPERQFLDELRKKANGP